MLIIYTGDGKGKTSSAIGAAIRSVGWGKRVAVVQFIKEESWPSGEREVLRKLGVDVFVMGKSWVGIMGDKKDLEIHKSAAQEGIQKVIQLIQIVPNKTNKLDKSSLRSSRVRRGAGLKANETIETSKKYDLVVCDEILGALFGKLITKSDVLKILNSAKRHPELDSGSRTNTQNNERFRNEFGMTNIETDLILTGRNAPDWLIKKADLVTEMKKIKHPFDSGILAKKGIDY